MTRTYSGSCHCGAVRFECEVDLKQLTSKCNCSVCMKTRFWKTIVKAGALRLLEGEEALTDYQFGSNSIHHLFCSRCGVKPFGRGHMDELGGTFFAINVACLDDATPQDLAEAPVRYEDGRHDDWGSPPAETRHL
jgi:hypothetical protein